jgi:hypothetical protein
MNTLPPTLLKLYRELSDDVGDLVHGWSTLREMSLDKATGDVLRAVSDRYFALTQAALLSYCVAIVARLLDRPKAAGHRTCSMEVFLTELGEHGFDARPLHRLLREARRAARKVIKYRHQRVGHNSYAALVEETGAVLFKFVEFDAATTAIITLINEIEQSVALRRMDYRASDGTDDLRRVTRILKGDSAG